MRVKEESERASLRLNIKKKLRSWHPNPIIVWQVEGEKVVTDFLFLSYKITADGDCSHEIRRWLLLGRKMVTKLDSVLKSRDITLPTKVHTAKAMSSHSSCMVVRAGPWRRQNAKELTLLNCGAGEDSWKSPGWQGDQTSQP